MPHLDTRQHTLLMTLIEEHIQSAAPVASQSLVGKPGLEVSPATIRNELMDLEEAGMLHQPHTSAGRVPTEQAWRVYIEYVLNQAMHETGLPRIRGAEELRQVFAEHGQEPEQRMRRLARTLADLCNEAVIVGFSARDVYYTGLTHLFRQPEFTHIQEVLEISRVVDRLDEIVEQLFPNAEDRIQVLLGSENPLGEGCSLMMTRCLVSPREHGFMAVLGPLRQSYTHHLAALRYATILLRG